MKSNVGDAPIKYKDGSKKSFQCHMKENKKTINMAGRDNGSIIFQKVWIVPAPSILADSSSSFGSVEKNCRKIIMNSEPFNPWAKIAGIMNGSDVLTQCNLE